MGFLGHNTSNLDLMSAPEQGTAGRSPLVQRTVQHAMRLSISKVEWKSHVKNLTALSKKMDSDEWEKFDNRTTRRGRRQSKRPFRSRAQTVVTLLKFGNLPTSLVSKSCRRASARLSRNSNSTRSSNSLRRHAVGGRT